ncbi:MAG TPA: nicotinamide riboside transporter PnuC [Steroidobacteraceae bacterium]|nr:nicotinamide riboside transporter PnuC [Steroidobacteraceae bacterium]
MNPLEAVSVVLALAYLLLAVKRNRWCWVAGAASSAILIYLAARARLPMQAGLNGYYVLMSCYGFWHWSRDAAATERRISVSPLPLNVVACAAVVIVSLLTAHWLSMQTRAAWPYLDSLTTWASLYATWLTARVKLDNWIWWLAIDSLLAYLFAVQGLYLVALLMVAYLGIAIAGYFAWQKSYRLQNVPA